MKSLVGQEGAKTIFGKSSKKELKKQIWTKMPEG